MVPRLLFIIFTIAFIAYTWFHTGQAKSCSAVNDPTKGWCHCNHSIEWLNKDGVSNTANINKVEDGTCNDDCEVFKDKFCNEPCPNAKTPEEQEQLCPWLKDPKSLKADVCECENKQTVN